MPEERDYRPFLVVKLVDGLPVVDAAVILRELVRAAGVPEGVFAVERLYRSVEPERIAALQATARRRDPDYGRQAPDLNTYFAVFIEPWQAEGLIEFLSRDSRVDLVYEPAGPQPPPDLVTQGANPKDGMQGYLKAAPEGINSWFGWTLAGTGIPGSDGLGIGFIDIEQGWVLDHPDLVAAGINVLSGVSNGQEGHGTSVLGIVLAVNNTVFCVGIANRADADVVSEWRTYSDYDRADAILDAVDRLSFGDVMLIESQIFGAPVEVEKANFDAIRLGTALGLIVVEPAGNGNYDLDTYVITWGSSTGTFLDRSAGPSGGFRDSGAIMVAAASATTPHVPTASTSYGSRIDCYAWGENAFTLGDTSSQLNAGFSGTSSASAIVAGAALAVQGASAANLGFRQSGEAMRDLLPAPGLSTPSKDPPTDRIGRMPDLRAIFSSSGFELTPDVYMRDHVGDTGDPHAGPVSISPDIIVRAAAVPDPQAAFGDGSGTENDPALSDQVTAGVSHTVYVRVRNRGGGATGVQAAVYWAPVATLVTPSLWTLIGQVTLPMVPGAEVLTVSPPIPWPAAAVPADGHYCFVALIGTAGDPLPTTADFGDMDTFRRFIRERNNATWRNFNVVSGGTSALPGYGDGFALPFKATGPPDRSRRMAFEVIGRLPDGARAWIETPIWMVPARRLGPHVRIDRDTGMASVPVNPRGITAIGEYLLPADAGLDMRLIVTVPDEHRRHGCGIAVRQLWRGEEVGRVTWRIAGRGLGEPDE